MPGFDQAIEHPEWRALIDELHHRVKNHLQVITSVIALQERRSADPKIAAAVRATRNRVRAVAGILGSSSNPGLTMVSFGDYLLRLINELAAEYAMSDRVQTEIRTADMALDVEQAIPLALIGNELAANALEHAFPAGTHGRICVALSYASEPDEYGVLEVSDDGVPLPATFDLKTAESTGLYLVRTLASQLRAQLTVEESTPGKTFRLRFPLAN